MRRLFQVSSKVYCEQECWHLSLTPPVSTIGFSIECLRRSVPALAFTGEDRDSSKGLQGLQPPHYTPVLTVSQGTGNLWLPSTALWVLLTLQPYTGLVWSMGEDLQAVQGWSHLLSPCAILWYWLPISHGVSPPSCSHRAGPTHAPHGGFPTSKCISIRNFLLRLLAKSLPPCIEALKSVLKILLWGRVHELW